MMMLKRTISEAEDIGSVIGSANQCWPGPEAEGADINRFRVI